MRDLIGVHILKFGIRLQKRGLTGLLNAESLKLRTLKLAEEDLESATYEKRRQELEDLRTRLDFVRNGISKDEAFLSSFLNHTTAELAQTRSCPPSAALNIIYFFFDKTTREEFVGDILEEFPEQVSKLGWRLARLWVWKEVLYAGVFSLIDTVVKLWERVSPAARFFNSRR